MKYCIISMFSFFAIFITLSYNKLIWSNTSIIIFKSLRMRLSTLIYNFLPSLYELLMNLSSMSLYHHSQSLLLKVFYCLSNISLFSLKNTISICSITINYLHNFHEWLKSSNLKQYDSNFLPSCYDFYLIIILLYFLKSN
jgi:hypothetical protein